jgi:hypothetical protein
MTLRTFQISLIAFVGITSTLFGMLLIANPIITAYGFSLDFLRPGVLKSLLLPGVLFTVIGSINLAALFTSIQTNRNRYIWTFLGSLLIIVWVVIDSIILQTIPWLYLTYLICCLIIILLTLQLKGKWAA